MCPRHWLCALGIVCPWNCVSRWFDYMPLQVSHVILSSRLRSYLILSPLILAHLISSYLIPPLSYLILPHLYLRLSYLTLYRLIASHHSISISNSNSNGNGSSNGNCGTRGDRPRDSWSPGVAMESQSSGEIKRVPEAFVLFCFTGACDRSLRGPSQSDDIRNLCVPGAPFAFAVRIRYVHCVSLKKTAL